MNQVCGGGSAFRGSLGRCLKNANHMNEQPPKMLWAKAFPSAAAPLLTLRQPTCASCCLLSTQTDATQQVGRNGFLRRLAGGGAGPVEGRPGSVLAALLSSSSKHPHHPTLNPTPLGVPGASRNKQPTKSCNSHRDLSLATEHSLCTWNGPGLWKALGTTG